VSLLEVWSLLVSRLSDAFARVTENFLVGLADVLVVLLFVILGWIVGKIFAAVVGRFLERVGLEKSLRKRGIDDALFGFTLTGVIEKFVKLLTYAAFLGIAAEVVNLTFLGDLVYWFVGYAPLLVQGATVLVLALLAVEYISAHLKKSGMPFKRLASAMLKVFVGYTAIVIATPLVLPNADVGILYTAFSLFVAAFALAFGLGMAIALGLGLKDAVAMVARKRISDIEELV